MKILSVVTETKQLRFLVLSGTRSSPHRESSKLETIPYPPDIHQGSGLDTMLRTLAGLIAYQKPCKVAVLLSVPAMRGGVSVRPVIEALLKLACHQEHQEYESIHPVALRAREKRFIPAVGKSPEEAFNDGANFKPAISKDAHLTGWSGLPE
jgi:hypothetical protein